MRDLPEIKLSRLPDEKFRHSTLWICLWPILHFPGHNVLFVLNMVYSCVSRVAMIVFVRIAARACETLVPRSIWHGLQPPHARVPFELVPTTVSTTSHPSLSTSSRWVTSAGLLAATFTCLSLTHFLMGKGWDVRKHEEGILEWLDEASIPGARTVPRGGKLCMPFKNGCAKTVSTSTWRGTDSVSLRGTQSKSSRCSAPAACSGAHCPAGARRRLFFGAWRRLPAPSAELKGARVQRCRPQQRRSWGRARRVGRSCQGRQERFHGASQIVQQRDAGLDADEGRLRLHARLA